MYQTLKQLGQLRQKGAYSAFDQASTDGALA